MTIEEARMSLFLMGWEMTTEVPTFWERWRLDDHNVYFRLDIIEENPTTIGRMAEDGNSIYDVSTYAGMVQLALNINEESK